MKKIPILLLTLMFGLIFGIFFPTKAQALSPDESGVAWWSVEELLAFSQFADREEEELCGDDFSCREELLFSRFESEDARYQILDIFREGRFWITSINPTEETLEVLYFDEDQMLKRWGINEKQPLEFIFLAWFDKINGQIGNYDYNLPIEPQFSDDLHLVYASEATSYSKDGFPTNIPFKLSINSTNLSENHIGRLYIAVFGENYNSKGYLDYSSCLQEVDYKDGTTCKLMFSSGGSYRYLPSRETLLENGQDKTELITEETLKGDEDEIAIPEDITAEFNGTDAIEEPKVVRDLDKTKDIKDTKKVESTIKNLATNFPSNSIKAPDTGVKPCEKVIEFPWWLGILIVIGNIVFLWFFGPNSKKV